MIRARSDLQWIVTQAKLARLLLDIQAPSTQSRERGYTIILDGPASVLRQTRRYGVNMARFVPALLSCKDWTLAAEIRKFGRPFRLELSSETGLTCERSAPQEFDSSVEENFAKKWGQEPRDGWSLRRADKILHRKQVVFVPDFSFTNENAQEALLEIVGFWTPEYLRAKIEKLKLFQDQRIILAVAEAVAEKWDAMPRNVILYKTALKPEAVLAALASFQTGNLPGTNCRPPP